VDCRDKKVVGVFVRFSCATSRGTIQYSREKELHRSEISEFIPSDAYYCF
jgi:hypothetical protein